MKTAVSLPDPLFEAGETLARHLRISRSQLYARAIEAFVEAHRKEGVTEALDRVYSAEDSRLDPVLERIQAASLKGDEW